MTDESKFMERRMSDLSRLNLDDVRKGVYDKYDVSRSDAELAVEYLRCFLDAKRARPEDLIILPQIADWAWHELILDTARYSEICSQIFGRFLHHVRERVISESVRESFKNSLKMLHNVYGLGFGDRPNEWREAGWNTPIYRLRNPNGTPHYAGGLSGHGNDAESDRSNGSPTGFLSWLPLRIAQRFGVPIKVARQGVREYSELFLSSQPSRLRAIPTDARSILCEIACEEHVLWTQQYMQDCYRVHGSFIDHQPRRSFSTAARSSNAWPKPTCY
jgi:hypothetical protein